MDWCRCCGQVREQHDPMWCEACLEEGAMGVREWVLDQLSGGAVLRRQLGERAEAAGRYTSKQLTDALGALRREGTVAMDTERMGPNSLLSLPGQEAREDQVYGVPPELLKDEATRKADALARCREMTGEAAQEGPVYMVDLTALRAVVDELQVVRDGLAEDRAELRGLVEAAKHLVDGLREDQERVRVWKAKVSALLETRP